MKTRIYSIIIFLAAVLAAFGIYKYVYRAKDKDAQLPLLSLSAPSAFVGNQASFSATLDAPAKDTVVFSLRWNECTALTGGENIGAGGTATFIIPAGEKGIDMLLPWDVSGMVPGEYCVTFFVCDVKNARIDDDTSVSLTFSVEENRDGEWAIVSHDGKAGGIALVRRDDGWYEARDVRIGGEAKRFRFMRNGLIAEYMGADGPKIKPGEFVFLSKDGGDIVLDGNGRYDIFFNPSAGMTHVEPAGRY